MQRGKKNLMFRFSKKHARLLSFFIGSSGYLVPRPLNKYVKVSKTMHPFLLGKRNIHYFYNLEKALYGIRAAIEVLKNIIARHGKVVFIDNSFLLQPRFLEEPNISTMRWKRGCSILKPKDADLVFLKGFDKEAMVEVHRKSLLLVGVGSPTMSKIAYPFNLNVNSPALSDWFFGATYTSCVQGKRILKKSKKRDEIKSLLGKGKSKSYKSYKKRKKK